MTTEINCAAQQIMDEMTPQVGEITQEWQHISTAPKDGTPILVFRPTADDDCIRRVGMDYWMTRGTYYKECWAHSNAPDQPTHWMPLPKPPEKKE